MSIVDVLIVIFVLLGAVVGFKQGFFKSLVNFVGVVVVIVLSFMLKNSISIILMKICPFFPFGGLIKGVTVLNIALYEVIAFALIFSFLMLLLKVISAVTGVFENLLKMTVVLAIPSKLLGMVVGLIENYVIVFFVIYFLALPNFADLSVVHNSKLKDPILKNTPILSSVVKDNIAVLDEFADLSDKYKTTNDTNQFNLETLDLFLKYRITTVKTVRMLMDEGKINISGVEDVLAKYE